MLFKNPKLRKFNINASMREGIAKLFKKDASKVREKEDELASLNTKINKALKEAQNAGFGNVLAVKNLERYKEEYKQTTGKNIPTNRAKQITGKMSSLDLIENTKAAEGLLNALYSTLRGMSGNSKTKATAKGFRDARRAFAAKTGQNSTDLMMKGFDTKQVEAYANLSSYIWKAFSSMMDGSVYSSQEMREIADRIDGGAKGTKTTDLESFTPEEMDEVLELISEHMDDSLEVTNPGALTQAIGEWYESRGSYDDEEHPYDIY